MIGQIIGASNYDIGHLALGNPGGGVAQLNAVGNTGKARGCTGLTTPIGDFFAVDYVAHEMGHQFGGNHTFNGTQSNCGGNKAAPSVEPGSGSSIMAYAGICRHDNLQPHSDPYWSQWSYGEINAYVSSSRPPINEVQTVSLRDFDGTDSFRLRFNGNETAPIVRGTNYSTAGIKAALESMPGWPAGGIVTVRVWGAFGGSAATPLNDAGFEVTFGNPTANQPQGTLAALNQPSLEVVGGRRCERLRRRDPEGRPGRQQRDHVRAERQPRAGRDERGGRVHGPGADAVRAHRERDRLRRRRAHVHVGAEGPRRRAGTALTTTSS